MVNFNISVPENKVPFFKELITNLNFVKIQETEPNKFTAEQQEFVDGLKDALHEVELHRQGKMKLKTIDEVLDEL